MTRWSGHLVQRRDHSDYAQRPCERSCGTISDFASDERAILALFIHSRSVPNDRLESIQAPVGTKERSVPIEEVSVSYLPNATAMSSTLTRFGAPASMVRSRHWLLPSVQKLIQPSKSSRRRGAAVVAVLSSLILSCPSDSTSSHDGRMQSH